MYVSLIYESKLKSIVLFNIFLLNPLKWQLQLKQGLKKNLCYINLFLKFLLD
jgi:hypothetical protein